MNMILTSECEQCTYGIIDESNKARIKVKCNLKNKEYHYGQCIPCENKRKRKEEEKFEESSAV
ncbi:hypothetical protein NSB25_20905 [Acetatifactor muris]|uniref:Uncharacterized protein n=1 Tax=Acetatifactor muris TaxID=879566 RepID=A0A2K4ZLX3_9FIRM|nr:hypothetical protein [Acetatifactor muris]MCR2049718.1 hypothetical protein [Acetatifactor muris]SOY31478.1 hypothetical protein AMURIS_04221 [Acetatifactor muris]